jgi:hypothetical protein
VRDNSRRRMARAKSHRASAGELAEAKVRVKEIEQELAQIPLLIETTHGEDREARYARVLKLRMLRQEFEAQHPYDKRPHANSLLLSFVLVVASFIFCAAIGLTAYGSYRFLTDKPDPVSTATNFWSDMETQQYKDAHANFFSPTLRVQEPASTFSNDAGAADATYGPITAAVLTSKQADASTATLTYKVTRTPASGKAVVYTTTIVMELFQGSWGVSNLGATINPSQGGAVGPSPTPSPSPTKTKR